MKLRMWCGLAEVAVQSSGRGLLNDPAKAVRVEESLRPTADKTPGPLHPSLYCSFR